MVPHHFSPGFFLPITETIHGKSVGNRCKRRTGKEWCSGRRKRWKQWKTKVDCESAQTPPPALQNPKTRYESGPHGIRNSKIEETFLGGDDSESATKRKKTNQKIRHRDVTGFIWMVEDDGGGAQRKKSYQRIERVEFYPVKTKNHFCPGVGGEGADTVCFFQLILECSRFLPGDITAHHLPTP